MVHAMSSSTKMTRNVSKTITENNEREIHSVTKHRHKLKYRFYMPLHKMITGNKQVNKVATKIACNNIVR